MKDSKDTNKMMKNEGEENKKEKIPTAKKLLRENLKLTNKVEQLEHVLNRERESFRNIEQRYKALENDYHKYAKRMEERFNDKMEEIDKTTKKNLNLERERMKKNIGEATNYNLSGVYRSIVEEVLSIGKVVINLPEGASKDLVNYAKGFQMLVDRLESILVSNGLKITYPNAGDPFDPLLHYAVGTMLDKTIPPPGKIIEVHSPHYSLNDKTISYAKVKVAINSK